MSRTHVPHAAPSVLVALLLTGSAVGLLSLQGCGTETAQAAAAQAPSAVPVSVAQVLKRDITDYDEFTGRFEAVERVELRPRVSGTIESVRFREGAEVRRGDVLFVIDARPYEATLKSAEANLARTQSARRQAQTERQRAETLLALHALSQEEFDARTSGNEQADAEVQAAQAAVDAAKLDLGFTQVRAPIDGMVGRAEITAGNVVHAGDSRLTTLVSMDPMYVRFEGDESAYLRYVADTKAHANGNRQVTQPVGIGLADEQGFPHAGALVFMDNELDTATGTIHARARIDNHEREFTPGMFARVQLAGRGSYPAVLVKDSAVGTDQNLRYVYVVNAENTVEYRGIELGPLHDGLRVVRKGLEPGDRVVVNGLQRVRPGAVVAPQVVAMEKTTPRGGKVMLAGNQP
jgi:RND family efflux transporter MFP subunit